MEARECDFDNRPSWPKLPWKWSKTVDATAFVFGAVDNTESEAVDNMLQLVDTTSCFVVVVVVAGIVLDSNLALPTRSKSVVVGCGTVSVAAAASNREKCLSVVSTASQCRDSLVQKRRQKRRRRKKQEAVPSTTNWAFARMK